MRLIFTSGSRAGQAVQIDGAPLTIGRVEDNDIQLPDSRVSGHHAVIAVEDGGSVVLRDLNSRNGSYVDEARLSEPRVLHGGEQLRFGGHQLRVEAPASETPATGRAWITRRRAIVAIVVGTLVLLLLAAQLFLPGVAEHKLRSDLERYGPVDHVQVEAVPAVTLAWQRANRVEVAMGSYRSEPGGHGSIADFLSDTRKAHELDARVGTLDAGLVTLHDVRLQKDGDALVAHARLTQDDLATALPDFVDVRPVAASGNGIVVRARGSALGQSVAVRLRILADDGHIVVQPDGLPFGSLASVGVFKDPRVHVDSLGARLAGNQYLLVARGHLE
jgi:hypothetical protein